MLLQYIWKNSLLTLSRYTACTGEHIEIVSPGTLNRDGGPDFTDAKIRIDGTLWAGNVEIHSRASDWEKHRHDSDPAYDNVILHAVFENDRPCFTSTGRRIPGISLQVAPGIERNYRMLLKSSQPVRCERELGNLDPFLISFWFNSLSVERIRDRTHQIFELMDSMHNSWESAFYIHLARSFGLRINALPFELLAKSLPYTILLKHKHSIHQIESLLFGQAGFLDREDADPYFRSLQKEYLFLKKKYRLTPLPPGIWKFMRLRPANFPTRRIAQFAALLQKNERLFDQTMRDYDLSHILTTYSAEVSDYWKKHYTFGKGTPVDNSGKMGKSSLYLLISNSIVPFKFACGIRSGREALKENAVNILEELPAEMNHTIRYWKNLGIKIRHAGDSQAVLQLANHYCREARCLDCQIGNRIIQNSV